MTALHHERHDHRAIHHSAGLNCVTSARANLYRLIDQVTEDAEPLTITGQRGNAVLVGEDVWRAIQEILFLASIQGDDRVDPRGTC